MANTKRRSGISEYKYLGDVIMRDGKNKRNIEEREVKVMVSTRKIIGLCGSNVIQKIEMKALLNKGEREKIGKIELWALKKILGIPITTPTPAIWFTTGYLLTPILIDRRQLSFLKTLLDRPDHDWTKQMLYVLDGTLDGHHKSTKN